MVWWYDIPALGKADASLSYITRSCLKACGKQSWVLSWHKSACRLLQSHQHKLVMDRQTLLFNFFLSAPVPCFMGFSNMIRCLTNTSMHKGVPHWTYVILFSSIILEVASHHHCWILVITSFQTWRGIARRLEYPTSGMSGVLGVLARVLMLSHMFVHIPFRDALLNWHLIGLWNA